MHVCLLSMEWPPHGGGIGSYMFNLARGLVSAGHRVTVITHDRNPVVCPGVGLIPIPLPDERRTLVGRLRRGTRRVLWGVRHPWSWEAYRAFGRMRETEPVDIVETADFGAWGWHFLRDGRVPLVVRCHAPAHIAWSANQATSESWRLPSFLRKQDRLERDQTYRAAAIASPSQALAYHLSLSWVIPLSRFTVIPNPIDADLFCPSDRQAEGREILYVGRLEYNKGVYDLAEAVVPLLAQHPDICVHFVGMDRPAPQPSSDGQTARAVIRRMVPERFHDRLRFTSHVPVTEIVALQRKAACAVVPTRGFDNFPYTVLESMACGTPVIVTRCGGAGEIITHNVDGLLVPPGNPHALTEAMRDLLSDPLLRRRLGACGRRTVETRYSTSAVLPKIVDWYLQAIRRFKGKACPT
jgi:glycogen synthase